MTRDDRKYVRVFYDLPRDYPAVYANDAALAAWLRLLMLAEAIWPAPADLPRSVKAAGLRLVVDAGLVELLPGQRFRIKGQDAERSRRSQVASASAQLRWSRPVAEGGRPASRATRFKVLNRDDFTCRYCGRRAPDVVLDVDHVVPVREGGTDAMTNLVTACVDCNTGKSGHPLDARALEDDVRAHGDEGMPSRAEQSNTEQRLDRAVEDRSRATPRLVKPDTEAV